MALAEVLASITEDDGSVVRHIAAPKKSPVLGEVDS